MLSDSYDIKESYANNSYEETAFWPQIEKPAPPPANENLRLQAFAYAVSKSDGAN